MVSEKFKKCNYRYYVLGYANNYDYGYSVGSGSPGHQQTVATGYNNYIPPRINTYTYPTTYTAVTRGYGYPYAGAPYAGVGVPYGGLGVLGGLGLGAPYGGLALGGPYGRLGLGGVVGYNGGLLGGLGAAHVHGFGR